MGDGTREAQKVIDDWMADYAIWCGRADGGHSYLRDRIAAALLAQAGGADNEELQGRLAQIELLTHAHNLTAERLGAAERVVEAARRVGQRVSAYPSGSTLIEPPTEAGATAFWAAIRELVEALRVVDAAEGGP